MIMKRRLFMSKHKKKKSNGDDVTITTDRPHITSSSSSVATIVDESLTKSSSKRKLFRKHKSKSQKTVENQDSSQHSAKITTSGNSFESHRSPNVVLRRATKLSDANHNVPRTARRFIDQRVPGSVSSSRTASSASSSSSRRWSNRRPWSLVDTLQSPSPAEFIKYDGDSSDHASPSIFSNQVKTSEEELASDKENSRSRGFISDLFTRRFKRSSSGTTSIQPSSSDERISLRVKPSKKNKESLKNRRSWHPSSLSYPMTNSNLPLPYGTDPETPLSRSYTDPSRFRKGESQPEYGRYSAPTPVVDSLVCESSGSHSSVSTVVSAPNRYSKDPQDAAFFFSDQLSNRSSVQSTFSDRSEASNCSKCLAIKDNLKRNLCYCHSAPLAIRTSLNDDSSLFRSTISSIGTTSQSYLDDSSVPTSPHHPFGSGDTLDNFDKESDFDLKKTIAEAHSKLGGSLMDLTKLSSIRWSEEEFECTLTRRNVKKRDSKLSALNKNKIYYASSPHLNTFNVKTTKMWNKSLETQEVSPSLRTRKSSTNSAIVESPIKRAIGFPGVMLRRHRQLKNANDTQSFPISASGDSLSRQVREKQVFSLNLEDLPTYGCEKTPVDSDSKTKVEDGRELSSFAILYQRLLSHGWSADNTKDLDTSALNKGDLINLLLMPGIQLSGPENEKSGQNQEPTSKRVKTLRKSVASLANLISPRGKIQRSSSFKESLGPVQKSSRPPGSAIDGSSNNISGVVGTYTPGKKRAAKSTKNRCPKLWRETFDGTGFDDAELKRQEAIFEIYQGECDMVQDLKMAKQTYRDSMMTLKMLSEDEVSRIFGKLDCLLPLHEDFISRLEEARLEDGRTDLVGDVLLSWFPTLSPYNEYCANQSDAKETLDAVIGRKKEVRDFLQRCLESPFSRKLDLWSYLDLPRSRLVKYPLLLKAILKVTPPGHNDVAAIEKSLSLINGIIARVDDLTGERQCKFVQSKLEYLDEKKRCPEVEMSRKIVCSGQLKNSRGTKLQVFLFDLALVLTRNATRREKLTYQVWRQPLPLESLIVETEDGGKLSGSFRGNLLISDKSSKHSFRVKSERLNVAYTLTATDVHDKKQWLISLMESIAACQARSHDLPVPPTLAAGAKTKESGRKKLLRRSSSSKSDSEKSSDSHEPSSQHKLKAKKIAKKLSKMSPNARNNRKSTSEDAKPTDLLAVSDTVFDDGKTCRRSRSLTASPVSLFSAWNGRKRTTERSLTRSDSGTRKPPSGKPSRTAHNSTSKTPPRSPRLVTTRSTPDLFNVISRQSPFNKVKSDCDLSLPDTIVTIFDDAFEGEPYRPNFSHLIIDSPDHPAASDTSQNFPILEEDSITPVLKSFSSIHSSVSSPSISVSFPGTGPMFAWQLSESGQKIDNLEVSSQVSSSDSFVDAPLAMDDVGLILERAETDDADSDDVSFYCFAPMDSTDDVSEVLDDLLNRVCDSILASDDTSSLSSKEPFASRKVERKSFITITSDDGSLWRGDRLEMSV